MLYNTGMQHNQRRDTSWHGVKKWYNSLVGADGHYYHKHIVIPGVLRLLSLTAQSSVVDLGCGQGVLARALPTIANYLGLDAASGLIAEAKAQTKLPGFAFQVQDVTKQLSGIKPRFTHAVFVLSLQNMKNPAGALKTASNYLLPGGELVIVLNHPCFRIPRQSGWNVDEKTKLQSRWINRYLSPLEIPITMSPGQRSSQVTWSYHHALQDYMKMLTAAGFVVTGLEEWASDKESQGKAAKMENRSRAEIPLFMAITAQLRTANATLSSVA